MVKFVTYTRVMSVLYASPEPGEKTGAGRKNNALEILRILISRAEAVAFILLLQYKPTISGLKRGLVETCSFSLYRLREFCVLK